ncbi:MAG TPA: M20/M25/M40 family metallo-hydrolase [Candidatus Polarisedimenticolia bacterium]|nr:M20/M25/M40 family metallo-hydrolase [Candidatus Polarisedimenticolia bacterium]
MSRPSVNASLSPIGRWLVIAALGAASGAQAQTSTTRPPERFETLGRAILSELISIDSTHEHGSTAAAQAVAARALAAGFPPGDVAVLAPADHPEKGNVVLRLRGRAHDRPVLYIAHLDVVQARREDWTFDPFRLTEKEGWLYGRGTIDMKGQDAAVLTSLIRMKQEGVVPARDVIAAFTADEEAGGDANGVAWLFKEHRDLLDATLVVNPDGGEAGLKQGRKLYVAVQTSEKLYMTFALEATDKGGHSSRPTAENPIYRLAAGLERLAKLRFPVHLTETTKLYFARRAEIETGPLQSDMRAILRVPPDAAAVERLSAAVETNIQLRTTCTTTMIEGGHAENALPQRARATVQCRVIPGESQDSVAAAIAATLADPKVVVSVVTPSTPAPESPPAPTILSLVEGVTRSMWPGVVVLPEMSPGATDSIHTRALGIPSYGIDGMFDDLDDGRAHGRDERIGVVAFAEEIEFTYRLMRAFGDAR